jgi:hypothetical protein
VTRPTVIRPTVIRLAMTHLAPPAPGGISAYRAQAAEPGVLPR